MIVAYFKLVSRHSSGGKEEIHKNIQSQCSRCFNTGLNQVLPDVLPLQITRSFS